MVLWYKIYINTFLLSCDSLIVGSFLLRIFNRHISKHIYYIKWELFCAPLLPHLCEHLNYCHQLSICVSSLGKQ